MMTKREMENWRRYAIGEFAANARAIERKKSVLLETYQPAAVANYEKVVNAVLSKLCDSETADLLAIFPRYINAYAEKGAPDAAREFYPLSLFFGTYGEYLANKILSDGVEIPTAEDFSPCS